MLAFGREGSHAAQSLGESVILCLGENVVAGSGFLFAKDHLGFGYETEVSGFFDPFLVNLSKFLELVFVLVIVCEVVDFVGIVLEIVEFFDRLAISHEESHG